MRNLMRSTVVKAQPFGYTPGSFLFFWFIIIYRDLVFKPCSEGPRSVLHENAGLNSDAQRHRWQIQKHVRSVASHTKSQFPLDDKECACSH